MKKTSKMTFHIRRKPRRMTLRAITVTRSTTSKSAAAIAWQKTTIRTQRFTNGPSQSCHGTQCGRRTWVKRASKAFEENCSFLFNSLFILINLINLFESSIFQLFLLWYLYIWRSMNHDFFTAATAAIQLCHQIVVSVIVIRKKLN